MLVIDHIFYKIKSRENILNDLSLKIGEGEFVGLVGSSGTGKTTLLRCVSGLIKPTSGKIKLNDQNITENPIKERSISFMQQGFPLYEHLSVLDNVLIAENKKTSSKARNTALKLLKTVEISQDFFSRRPETLSGGEAQRVALCKAILRPTKLLLLDEPFSNLDKSLKRKLGEFVRKLAKKRGQAVLFVSHDESDVLFLSDRVCVMEQGTVLQYDTLLKLSQSPIHQKVAAFALENGLQTLPLERFNDVQLTVIKTHFSSIKKDSMSLGWRSDSSILTSQVPKNLERSQNIIFSVKIQRQVPATGGTFIQLQLIGLNIEHEIFIWHFECQTPFSDNRTKVFNLIIKIVNTFLITKDGTILID